MKLMDHINNKIGGKIMKKIVNLIVILFSVLSVYSQNNDTTLINQGRKDAVTISEQNRKIMELQDRIKKDSLSIRQLKSDTVKYKNNIRKLEKDKIIAQKTKYEDFLREKNQEINKLRDKIKADSIAYNKKIKADTAAYNNKIKEYEGKITKLNTENSTLKQENNSWKATEKQLKNKIGEQQKEIEGNKKNIEIHAKIIDYYKKTFFDELIKSSNVESVKRDLQLFKDNNDIKPKLENLQQYFLAQNLLSEKYDKEKISAKQRELEDIQNYLKAIRQESKLVNNLKTKIDNYEAINNDFIEIIKDIKKIDTKTVPQELQEKKKEDIFKIVIKLQIALLFDYGYNFNDYPYLSNIILEIIKIKQSDANANIKDLIDNF